jgi:uncharacterized membrane protein YdcZ (DUF606 family)
MTRAYFHAQNTDNAIEKCWQWKNEPTTIVSRVKCNEAITELVLITKSYAIEKATDWFPDWHTVAVGLGCAAVAVVSVHLFPRLGCSRPDLCKIGPMLSSAMLACRFGSFPKTKKKMFASFLYIFLASGAAFCTARDTAMTYRQ